MFRLQRLLLAVFVSITCVGSAHAQIFGQMGPLEGMSHRNTLLGAYLGLGNGDVSPSAELRVGSGHRATMGIAAAVENSAFAAQGDLRGGLTGTGGDFPMELGGQVALGMVTGNGVTGIYGQVVPGLSFSWDIDGNSSFSTWAGLGFRLTASSKSAGDGAGIARLGTRYNLSPSVGLGANLEDVGGATKLIAGADYTF